MDLLQEWIRNMELPSFYKPLHRKEVETLRRLQFDKRINAFRNSPGAKAKLEMPNTFSDLETQDENHALRATQLLRQARRFIEMGLQAEDEIKPLLLYYGVAQACGFFVCSICKYPDLSKSHGITVDEDLNVVVRDSGAFVRLLDVYSLFGTESQYCRFIWDEAQSTFVESQSSKKYPFSKPLQTIYLDAAEILQMNPSAEKNVSLDHLSYLLLFVASHLARYRPEVWKSIVEGEGTDVSMTLYRRVMEEAKTFSQKVVGSILLASKGTSPRYFLNKDSSYMANLGASMLLTAQKENSL